MLIDSVLRALHVLGGEGSGDDKKLTILSTHIIG